MLHFGCRFLYHFCPLLRALLRALRRRENRKYNENPLVFVGRKTYAAFSRRGRSDQIVEGLGCKTPPENKCKKSSHGTTETVTKMIFFEAKIGPKMDPGGLRKSVRTTGGHRATDLTQACVLNPRRRRPEDPQNRLSTYNARLTRGWRSFDARNFGARGPWGGLARAV